MKKPTIIFIGIVIIAVLGISIYTLPNNSSRSDAMMKKESSLEDNKMKDDKMTASRYVQYSKSALDDAAATRRVLFFYASWCPTCKPADVSFTQNESRIPEDVTVIRVNYNDPETNEEEKDLATKYGVTYQHTFVQIDSAGNVVNKWNGGQIDELLSLIK